MLTDLMARTGGERWRADAAPSSSVLHWGQFLLGPEDVELPAGWVSRRLSNGAWLGTHPELPVHRATAGESELVLIGYVLDPREPEATDTQILERLLRETDSLSQLLRASAGLGGRWALVAFTRDGAHAFTDALGLRQVFHTRAAEHGGVWVMSQPGLALECLGSSFDPAAVAFVDSYAFRAAPEYRWPGAESPVAGLRHLLPNHVLDLCTGQVARYWPDGPLDPLRPSEAIERAVELLRGLVHAAALRYELALSLTAGLDSRLVLAAARDVRERLSYVTVRQARMPDHHDDIRVPARLLARIGLPHEVIRARAAMSASFSWAYKRNVLYAHDHYGADAEAILQHFGRRKIAMTGSGAEVGRCSFRRELPLSDYRRITAGHLAHLQRMYHPYARRCFEEWLADAAPRANVKLLDLFEWEQGHGNWLAMTQLEFDTAWRDIFTPYNCRELLTTFLAAPERLRSAPDYPLFKQMIRHLWPELLCEPINPNKRGRLQRRWRRLLEHVRGPSFRTA